MEVSLGFGGARDFCGKRTKPNLEQHCPLIGVRMKKTRPYPLWAELSGQRETQEREISRTAMKGRSTGQRPVSPTARVKGKWSQEGLRALISVQWLGRHPISHGFSPSL